MNRLVVPKTAVASRYRRESIDTILGQQDRRSVCRNGGEYGIQSLFLERGQPTHRVQTAAEIKQQIQVAHGSCRRGQALGTRGLQIKSVLLPKDDRRGSRRWSSIQLQSKVGGAGIASSCLKYQKRVAHPDLVSRNQNPLAYRHPADERVV